VLDDQSLSIRWRSLWQIPQCEISISMSPSASGAGSYEYGLSGSRTPGAANAPMVRVAPLLGQNAARAYGHLELAHGELELSVARCFVLRAGRRLVGGLRLLVLFFAFHGVKFSD